MRERRLLVWVVAMSMLLGLLTACGNDTSGDDRTDITQENVNVDETKNDTEADINEDEKISVTESVDTNDEDEVFDFRSITKEQCRIEVDKLLSSEAVNPALTELLAEMARCATFARIIDEKGSIF